MAFSDGFIVGPLIGAYFSQQARLLTDVADVFFTSPALFALTLAALNVVFLSVCLQETLSADKRVGTCVNASLTSFSHIILLCSLQCKLTVLNRDKMTINFNFQLEMET